MPNPVVHWEIMAKDADKSREFYSKLFDWQVNADNPFNYGLVDVQEEVGIGGGIGPAPDFPNYVTIYVQVNDLQAYLDKAESLGGKTIMPPTEIPDVVSIALFSDPEGNTIGLVKGD